VNICRFGGELWGHSALVQRVGDSEASWNHLREWIEHEMSMSIWATDRPGEGQTNGVSIADELKFYYFDQHRCSCLPKGIDAAATVGSGVAG
jgi:hypothetical protein